LTRRLTRRGHHVTTATCGSEALARLQEAEFEVAILDFMMPGMNGLELARQCRERRPEMKLLILTGSPTIAEIEAESFACLRKPLENLQGLDEAIVRLLAGNGEEGGGRGAEKR
jgi:CheY-like chemotaxis protein